MAPVACNEHQPPMTHYTHMSDSRGRFSHRNLPTSSYDSAGSISAIPTALARDRRRRKAWLKARSQYARDKTSLQLSSDPSAGSFANPVICGTQTLTDCGPKRKLSSFVKEQESKCLWEDQVGTLHISELLAGDDVSAQLKVEELSVVGHVAALDTGDLSNIIVSSGGGFKLKAGQHLVWQSCDSDFV